MSVYSVPGDKMKIPEAEAAFLGLPGPIADKARDCIVGELGPGWQLRPAGDPAVVGRFMRNLPPLSGMNHGFTIYRDGTLDCETYAKFKARDTKKIADAKVFANTKAKEFLDLVTTCSKRTPQAAAEVKLGLVSKQGLAEAKGLPAALDKELAKYAAGRRRKTRRAKKSRRRTASRK